MSEAPIGSYSPGLNGYAPADFGDADEMRPSQMLLDPTGQGLPSPYSTITSNVLHRTLMEIKDKANQAQLAPVSWRRKLREFMVQKNEYLLGFLRKPFANHPTLSQADQFMRRFGRQDFQVSQNSNLLFDASGVMPMTSLESDMKRHGPASLQEIVEEVKWLYDTYKQAGEELTRQEVLLKQKLDTLDATYKKLNQFLEMPVNEETPGLAESIEKYMTVALKDAQLEQTYTSFVEAYRRFITLREMIQVFRFTELVDKEPLCSICLTESVNHALAPCGHTFCGNCLKKQMTACYICRTPIRERVKLFFG